MLGRSFTPREPDIRFACVADATPATVHLRIFQGAQTHQAALGIGDEFPVLAECGVFDAFLPVTVLAEINHGRFHFTVAELSADPALRLFAAIVLHLSGVHSNFSRRSRQDRDKVVRRIKKLHRDIANAMLARDAQRACRLMSNYLDGYRGWLG
jgi:hypothetical protein